MQKTLIILGLMLIAIGIAWPWLNAMSLGRLPGDIVIRRENFTFYLPITTMIVISVVLSLIFWLFRR